MLICCVCKSIILLLDYSCLSSRLCFTLLDSPGVPRKIAWQLKKLNKYIFKKGHLESFEVMRILLRILSRK